MCQPNIVFILTDDQRYDTICALGNSEISTPNLDQLVNEGTSFTQAHIPGGTSAAICMPSRAMIHSGKTLFHIKDNGSNIPSEHITLGETLKNNGYFCYGTGKWHNGCESFNRSFHNGENIFFGGMWDHYNVPMCHYHADGIYPKTKFVQNFTTSNKISEPYCDEIKTGIHSTDLIANSAIDFLKNYSQNNPYFLYVSFLAPHDPRVMPEKYKNMYDPEKISVPKNFMEYHNVDFGIQNMRDETLSPFPRTIEEVKKHTADYYAMISHLDERIGEIIAVAKKKSENTIIIFAADNGLAIGRHGYFGKQNLFDHSVRIPLILSGCSVPKGKQISNYVYLMDIYPSLCDLLGIETPKSVEGISFIPCILEQIPIRKQLYFAYNDRIRAVKDEQYKLMVYKTTNGKKIQMFDLVNDPNELHDISEDSKYQQKKKELNTYLIQFKTDWGDEKHLLGRNFWKTGV